jgi:hypothetical protein
MNSVPKIVVLAAAATVIAGCGSQGTQQSQSPSYQAGYTSGESGTAHNFLVETGNGTNGPDVAADSACSVSFTPAQMLNSSLVESDYEAGCHAALKDHPVNGGRPSH